jgi:dimethylaniline monooxygenase (N-oxide forming)
MSSTTSTSQRASRVIVIGAGWTGLAAAKTYLQINPNVSLTIIDEDSSVGGVWSSSRIYPGLLADSCAAIFDFSDSAMHEEVGIDKYADLPAEKVHEYLEHYVDRFGLKKHLRLNTKVIECERDEERKEGAVWKIEVECRKQFEEYTVREVLLCDKLIVASGPTSVPNWPSNYDPKAYAGPVLHSKDVGLKHELLTADNVKRVTVVGGSKSAIDVVYLCALAGKEVDWIIREDGYGPILLCEPRTVGGVHVGILKNIRSTTLMSPSIMWPSGFWYRFLHSGKSKLGTKLHGWVLEQANGMVKLYEGNENTMKISPDMKEYVTSSLASPM